MRRRMQVMVGAGVMAVAAIFPPGATALATPGVVADAMAEESPGTTAAWHQSRPFPTQWQCEQARTEFALTTGAGTLRCAHSCPPGCTVPGPGYWYFMYNL